MPCALACVDTTLALHGEIETSPENFVQCGDQTFLPSPHLGLICLTSRWTVLLSTPAGAHMYSPESETCNLMWKFYCHANTLIVFFLTSWWWACWTRTGTFSRSVERFLPGVVRSPEESRECTCNVDDQSCLLEADRLSHHVNLVGGLWCSVTTHSRVTVPPSVSVR